jgi:hypothetical protein
MQQADMRCIKEAYVQEESCAYGSKRWYMWCYQRCSVMHVLLFFKTQEPQVNKFLGTESTRKMAIEWTWPNGSERPMSIVFSVFVIICFSQLVIKLNLNKLSSLLLATLKYTNTLQQNDNWVGEFEVLNSQLT